MVRRQCSVDWAAEARANSDVVDGSDFTGPAIQKARTIVANANENYSKSKAYVGPWMAAVESSQGL